MAFEISNFFPIYDLLHGQLQNTTEVSKPLTDDEMKELILKVNSLDKMGRDMVYVFTRIHSLRYSDSKLLDIPYEGEKIDSKNDGADVLCNVKFDIRNFPVILTRMIERFTNLHLRKQQEDSLKPKVV